MRSLAFALLALLIILAPAHLPVGAAQSPATGRISPSNTELLVFEADKCLYCFIFRRDVVPSYMKSPRARDVPLRFIDIRQTDTTQMKLKAPLTTLPTVVLMKNGKEVDRINGYMGPEPFFHMISRLMK